MRLISKYESKTSLQICIQVKYINDPLKSTPEIVQWYDRQRKSMALLRVQVQAPPISFFHSWRSQQSHVIPNASFLSNSIRNVSYNCPFTSFNCPKSHKYPLKKPWALLFPLRQVQNPLICIYCKGTNNCYLKIISRYITHCCILWMLKNFEKYSYPLCQIPPPRDLKAGSVQRSISLPQ